MLKYDSKNTFNIIKDKIIEDVSIINNFNCPTSTCENDKLDAYGNCTICGYSDDRIQNSLIDLEISIIRLDEYFKNGTKRSYDFLDKLYSIKDMNIDFVNDFLKKLDYENIRNQELILFKSKFNDNTLNNEEIRRLESLILTSDNLKQDDIDILTKLVFKNNISKAGFRKFVLLFIENEALRNNIDLNSVKYGKTEEGHDADTYGTDIIFSKECIDRIYDLYELDSVFMLIYHELFHVRQNNDINNGVINPRTCKYIYDDLIRNNEKEFYKDNYNLINQEIDAQMMAYIYTKRLKDKFKIEYDNNILKSQIQKELELTKVEGRRLANYISNYHELVLNQIKNHPEYLEQFPVLQIEFKIVDGFVCRRSQEEVQKEIDLYNEEKNELLELKELYKIDSFKDLFTDSRTKDIINNKGLSYQKFYNDSNINKIRLGIIDFYDSLNKNNSFKNQKSRGYSSIAILVLSIIAILLLIVFIILIISVR